MPRCERMDERKTRVRQDNCPRKRYRAGQGEFEARDYRGEGPVGGGTPFRREDKILTASPLTLAVVYEWGAGELDALFSAPDHGYYFFRCEVPGRAGPAGTPLRGPSGVITYKVGEND
jgi:hypothetical protein